ncbi:hypothetical protein FNL11_01910 [Staphylococcus haemolyticus]|uniref:Uncharacterized protein n=1 Tax=Staphylococcus haemolyticus TaxID=1283 RepID=A0AB38PIE6_STAHA|nr:hypothetical protein [Staphylococcus sp. NWU MK-S]PTK53122.1 hypothetical protein BUZ37_09575 [Staphylococcus haemolyticus]TRL79240.1 hypothetical protein FNL11_01910 [Staphylococcus haemolyticus]
MNYKDRVTLYNQSESRYNPATKRKEVTREYIENVVCNRNCLTAENTRVEFGEITQDINVLRIPKVINYIPTHALIENREYKIVKVKHYQHTTSIFIREINP